MIDINENLLKIIGCIVIWACCFFIGLRMGKKMIRRLLCWRGFHDWYTLNRCTKPSRFICDRMYCDNCSSLEDREKICLNCGKPVKSPVFIDKDRGGNSGYTRKDIGKHRGIAGYRRRTITNKGTKIIIE